MSEWTKWTERRTPNERIPVRLRCKPKHKTVEGVSLVEWTTKQSLHGMGHDDMIFVPDGVSNWDGYNRTVPVDLEWRLLCEGEDQKKENTVWHGLSDKLAPCPFCGCLPHVSANETRGGRGVILSYSPNRYDTFEIRCCLPRISGMNVAALIAKWNARPDAESAIAEAVAAERERCVDIVANAAPGNDCALPKRDERLLTGLAKDIVEAIRSAAK